MWKQGAQATEPPASCQSFSGRGGATPSLQAPRAVLFTPPHLGRARALGMCLLHVCLPCQGLGLGPWTQTWV